MAQISNRIEWIDIAKGMSIILVVLGHSFIGRVPYLGDWLGSFRMPFFLFVSGLLFVPEKNTDFKKILKKKNLGLVRPFFIFSFFILLGYSLIGINFKDKLLSVLQYGWLGYALWFIPILLAANIIYFVICRYFKKSSYRVWILIICAVIGYGLGYFQIPNNWNIGFAFTAVFYYGLGSLLAPKLNSIFTKSSTNTAIYVVLFAIISLGFIINNRPEFYINRLANPFLTHIVGISGAIMLCGIAVLISTWCKKLKNDFAFPLKYFGRNSYVVLAFHQILIMIIAYYLPQTHKIFVHLFMWVILVCLIELITRKFPYILGR